MQSQRTSRGLASSSELKTCTSTICAMPSRQRWLGSRSSGSGPAASAMFHKAFRSWRISNHTGPVPCFRLFRSWVPAGTRCRRCHGRTDRDRKLRHTAGTIHNRALCHHLWMPHNRESIFMSACLAILPSSAAIVRWGGPAADSTPVGPPRKMPFQFARKPVAGNPLLPSHAIPRIP